jgi:hypothetical protein
MRLPVSTSAANRRAPNEPALSFLRHEQIYRPVRVAFRQRAQQCPTAPASSHRLAESAAGYSLAGCSPAEPASASPTRLIVRRSASTVNHDSLCGANQNIRSSVFSDIVWNASRPHLPENTYPSACEDAHSMGMSAAACSGGVVDVCRPGRTVTRVAGPGSNGSPQVVIAGPSEENGTRLTALTSDRCNAGLSRELIRTSQAFTNIAEFCEDLCRIEPASIWQAHDQITIVMLHYFVFDARGKFGDLVHQRTQDTCQRAYKLAFGLFFEAVSASHWGSVQASQQLLRSAPPAISLSCKKGIQPLFSKTSRTTRSRIAFKKSQGDWRVNLMKHRRRSRPKAFEQRPELVGESDPLCNQIIACTYQSTQSFDRVGSRLQQPEAMTVSAQYIGQQVGISAVVLGPSGTVTRSICLDRFGMNRHDWMPIVQQRINNQARGPLDGDGNRGRRSNSIHLPLQRLQAGRIVAYLGPQHDASGLIYHTRGMTAASPVQSREIVHDVPPIYFDFRDGRPYGFLTDRHSRVFPVAHLPVARQDIPASATLQISCGPSTSTGKARGQSWQIHGSEKATPLCGITPQLQEVHQ